MRRAGGLLLILLLAGCAAPQPEAEPTGRPTTAIPAPDAVAVAPGSVPPSTPSLASSPSVRAGPIPFLRHTRSASFEPTIEIADDGSIYMTALVEGVLERQGSTVLRSTDEGRTWSDIGPSLPAGAPARPYTGDPVLTLDRELGRLYLVDAGYTYAGANCLLVRWTDDGGAVWGSSLACGGGVHDHPTVVVAKSRFFPTTSDANVVHACVNRLVDAACTRSLDGGRTWGPMRPLVFLDPSGDLAERGLCATLTGPLAASSDGTLALGQACLDGPPMVAVSRDDGVTWDLRVVSAAGATRIGPIPSHDVVTAFDAAGVLHATWIQDGLPVLSSSADLGATWMPIVALSSPDVTAADFPALAGRDGRVAFAYIATAIVGGYNGRALDDEDAWEGATWDAYVGTLDADGTISISRANVAEDPIARGLCGGTRCDHASDASATTLRLRGIGDFLDVAVGADGRPWAAFVDTCTRACITDPSTLLDEEKGAVAGRDEAEG